MASSERCGQILVGNMFRYFCHLRAYPAIYDFFEHGIGNDERLVRTVLLTSISIV